MGNFRRSRVQVAPTGGCAARFDDLSGAFDERRAGLRSCNVGLDPAEIISGLIWLDGRKREEPFGKPVIDALRDELSAAQRRLSASTFTPGAVLATDHNEFVLSVDPFDPATDQEFVKLISRLRSVITYASLYGDKAVLDWSSQR